MGDLLNPVTVPDGSVGSLATFGRGTIASKVTVTGTLDLDISYVRGDFTGDWSASTGTVTVIKSTTAQNEFRLFSTMNGFGNAAVNLPTGVFTYFGTAPSPISFTFGELTGAGSLAGLNGTQVTYLVGGRNTDATFDGIIHNSNATNDPGAVGDHQGGHRALDALRRQHLRRADHGQRRHAGDHRVAQQHAPDHHKQRRNVNLKQLGRLPRHGHRQDQSRRALNVANVNGFSTNSNMTLGGTGSVYGSYNHNSGTLQPGDSNVAGTLQFVNDLTISGGNLNMDLGSTHTVGGGDNDLIAVTGAATLSGNTTLNFNLLPSNVTAGDYTLVHANTGLSGSASGWNFCLAAARNSADARANGE